MMDMSMTGSMSHNGGPTWEPGFHLYKVLPSSRTAGPSQGCKAPCMPMNLQKGAKGCGLLGAVLSEPA